MNQVLIIIAGFVVGELALLLILSWSYEQLKKEGFRLPSNTKWKVILFFLLVPVLIGGMSLPGILRRTQAAEDVVPVAGLLTPSAALTSQATPSASAPPLIIPGTGATSTAQPPSPTAPAATATARLTATTAPATAVPATPAPATAAPATSAPTALPTSTPAPTQPPPTNTPPPLPTNTPPPPPPTNTQPPPPTDTSIPTATTVVSRLNRGPAPQFPKATRTATAPASATPAPPTATQAPPSATIALPSATPTREAPPGKIVYVCQLFKDTDRDQICIMDADGTDFRRLTTNDNADYNYPSLSPDGRSVIYSGNDTGQFEIYEMDLESGSARQLTSGLGASLSPEISPDGQLIIFSVRADDHNSVWIMDRNGSNPHQIYGPPLADGWDPVWSPDGRFVLFASNWTGGIQLYIIQPDGQNLQQVTSMDGLSGRSAWSPDGITIATYSGPEWNHELLLMKTDGSNARQITHGGNNLAPSFSPDGRWIVFTSYRDRMQDDNGCEIYIMRTDGSQLTRLTDNEYCDWQPRWGP